MTDDPKSFAWAIPNGYVNLGIVNVAIHRKQHEERLYKFENGHDLVRFCLVLLDDEK